MNVLILNGGPRAKGRTATILRGIQDGAERAGADVTWVDLYKLEIAPCRRVHPSRGRRTLVGAPDPRR